MKDAALPRLRRALEDLLALEPEARCIALEGWRRSDPALHAELQALLTEVEGLGDFLEPKPAPLRVGGGMEDGEAELPPEGPAAGGFRLIRQVGAGGMATVWEAEQLSPRRSVAIKILHAGSDLEGQRRRLLREIQILAELRHPHIAAILAAGDGDETSGPSRLPWIALEFVRGADTIVRHAHARELSVPERLGLFLQALSALRHGHERGVIHRDIKPGNVLVGDEGVCKVIDFGIARLVGDFAARIDWTASGRWLGTLSYMAPERLDGRSDGGTVQSDIYSAGVLLHELLVDRAEPPSETAELGRTLERLRSGQARRLALAGQPRAADLRAVVAKATAVRPEDRYGSVGELAQDIEAWLRGDPVRARPVGPWRAVHAALRRHPLLRAGLWIGLPLLLIAAVVSVGFALAARAAALRSAQALAKAEAASYSANIAAAQASLRALDGAGARRRLEACPPEARGFEWWALRRASDRSEVRARVEGDVPFALEAAPCGRWYAVATVEGGVEWRDTSDGTLLARFEGDGQIATLLALGADGRHVLQGVRDGRLRVLGPEPGDWVRTLSLGPGGLWSLAGHPSEPWLASAHTGAIRLWDWNGAVLLQEHRLEGMVFALAISPDGEYLAAGLGPQAALVLLERESGFEHFRLPLEGVGGFGELSFSPDGQKVAMATHDGLVRIIDLGAGEVEHRLVGHAGIVERARFDASGQYLFSAGWDRSLRRWHVSSGRPAGILLGHESHVLALSVSSESGRLFTADRAGHLMHWSADGLWNERVPARHRWDWSLRFEASGGEFLALQGGRALRVQGAGHLDGLMLPTEAPVFAGAFGPGGTVALGDERGAVQVFGPASIPVARFGVGTATIVALAHCSLRKAWLTLDRRGELHEYDEGGGHRGAVVRGVSAFERAADGVLFLVISGEGLMRLDPGLSQSPRPISAGEPTVLRAHPQQPRIAAAYPSGRIEIYETVRGSLVARLEGHNGEVLALAFEPGEPSRIGGPARRRLASAGADGSVRLWDVESGSEIAALLEHNDAVHALDFHPEGDWLVSASLDGTVFWRHAGSEAQRHEWYRPRGGLDREIQDGGRPSASGHEVLALARDLLQTLRLGERASMDPKELARLGDWVGEMAPAEPLARFVQALAAIGAGQVPMPLEQVPGPSDSVWPGRFGALHVLARARDLSWGEPLEFRGIEPRELASASRDFWTRSLLAQAEQAATARISAAHNGVGR